MNMEYTLLPQFTVDLDACVAGIYCSQSGTHTGFQPSVASSSVILHVR